MEVPAEISEQLVGLQAALDALEEVLQPFLDMKPREMDTKVGPACRRGLPAAAAVRCRRAGAHQRPCNGAPRAVPCERPSALWPDVMPLQLAPLERAQAHLLLAQTVGQLFKVHLQLRGQRPEEHPIHKDLVSGRLRAQ
jgi:hypothetical protein